MFNIISFVIDKINKKNLTREQKDEIYFIKKDIKNFLQMYGFDGKEIEMIINELTDKINSIYYNCIKINNKLIDFLDNKNELCFEIIEELRKK